MPADEAPGAGQGPLAGGAAAPTTGRGSAKDARIWIDGAVVSGETARVPVFDRGFLYGDSVYEVVPSFGGRLFALDEHLDRLAQSASRLEMTLPERALIARASAEAARATGAADAYVRIMVTRGAGPLGLDPSLADEPRLIVIALPLARPDPALYRDGVEVAITATRRSGAGGVDPLIKSGNYLTSVLAQAEARRRGAYEAILCDGVGRIAEGGSSNVFVVRGGRVMTPSLSVGLLEGITRRHVIALAQRLGIAVDEGSLWPVDLERADEAFLTSSIRGVMPVVRVNHEVIGDGRPGPVTGRLIDAYAGETSGRP